MATKFNVETAHRFKHRDDGKGRIYGCSFREPESCHGQAVAIEITNEPWHGQAACIEHEKLIQV